MANDVLATVPTDELVGEIVRRSQAAIVAIFLHDHGQPAVWTYLSGATVIVAGLAAVVDRRARQAVDGGLTDAAPGEGP